MWLLLLLAFCNYIAVTKSLAALPNQFPPHSSKSIFTSKEQQCTLPPNMNIETTLVLNDGYHIPRFGLGVYQAANGGETEAAVYAALKTGYRHIDTAEVYRNEADVGKAIQSFMKETGLSRDALYITTKFMPARNAPPANEVEAKRAVHEAMEKSLSLLQVQYVDLYLMHSPHNRFNRLFEWSAMQELRSSGKTRSIGVSNYGVHHLNELLAAFPQAPPSVNQIELNPYITRTELVEYCQSRGIAVEAYSPLTKALKLSDPKLVDMATKYGLSSAQLLIRWCLQRGMIVIPKSVTASRIVENAHPTMFSSNISEEDMIALDGFDEYLTTGWDPTTGP